MPLSHLLQHEREAFEPQVDADLALLRAHESGEVALQEVQARLTDNVHDCRAPSQVHGGPRLSPDGRSTTLLATPVCSRGTAHAGRQTSKAMSTDTQTR